MGIDGISWDIRAVKKTVAAVRSRYVAAERPINPG
jgi:hypothetical protein